MNTILKNQAEVLRKHDFSTDTRNKLSGVKIYDSLFLFKLGIDA